MKFKAGQIVETKDKIGYSVLAGTKGLIKIVDREFYHIQWLGDGSKWATGVYFAWRFKLAIKPGEQLEFSFMNDD